MRLPMRCLGLKIEATVNTQIGMSMTIQGKSPFRTLESVQVFFANYRNSMTNQDKIVEVPYKHQWDNQTEIRIGIAANCTSTFTWYFGAILNTAKSLRKKADAATTQGSIPARL